MVRKSTLYKLLLFCLMTFVFLGCQYADPKKEISEISVDIEWVRFEQKFYKSSPDELPALKKAYPYFFPAQYPDSIWEQRLSDSLQLELFNQINRVFPSIHSLKTQVKSLFQHIKYYFPRRCPSFKGKQSCILFSWYSNQNRLPLVWKKRFVP